MNLDDKTRRHETRFRTLVLTLVASAVLGSVFAAAQVGRAQNELPPSEKKQKTEPSQRPVDLSMIQRAVSRGKITAKQGKQVLEFSKLREASKIGDLSPQDHLSPDIASRLEKLGITWVEGEALLIKTRKAAYVAHRVVFAHLEGYEAATSQIALVDTTRRTSLTHTRSTKVRDENGGVVEIGKLLGKNVLVVTEDQSVVSVDDDSNGRLRAIYDMGVSGDVLGRIRTELGRIGIDVQRIGAVEGVLLRLIAGMPESGEMDPRLRGYLENRLQLDDDQIEGLQDLASRLAAGSNPLRRLGVSDEALGPMMRALENMGIERERILAALGMVRHMVGREPDEDVRFVLEKQLRLTERQIDGLQEFANQVMDLEPEEIAVAREFYELREVVIKAERNFLTDEERRRLKELGITWEEGETLLKRAEREYRGNPFAKGGRLNRNR